MAKFFRKRDESATDDSTNVYMTSQPIDYTSLPVVENAGPLDRLKALPVAMKALLGLVVLLVLGGLIWAVLTLTAAPPPEPPPPVPAITLDDAKATNAQSIVVDATIVNATAGMTVTAELLEAGEPIEWADPETSSGEIGSAGEVQLRLRRASTWNRRLDPDLEYVIALSTFGAETVTKTLSIPAPIANDFYAPGVTIAPTPQPQPTAPSEPTAVVEPTPSGPPTLVTGDQPTLLISPTLGSGVLLTLPARTKVEPLLRTNDSKFYLVAQGNLVGWLPAEQATIDPQQVAAIKSVQPDQGAATAGPLTAVVANGGNIRYFPNVQTGTVLGQMIAGQTVTLKQKTANGAWYQIVAPAAEGWVSSSLLTIDARTAAAVPLAR